MINTILFNQSKSLRPDNKLSFKLILRLNKSFIQIKSIIIMYMNVLCNKFIINNNITEFNHTEKLSKVIEICLSVHEFIIHECKQVFVRR